MSPHRRQHAQTDRTLHCEVLRTELAIHRAARRLQITKPRPAGEPQLLLIVKEVEPQRTLAQNRLLQAWAVKVAAYTGHSVREVREFWASEFLGWDFLGVDPLSGVAVPEVRHTAALSIDAFTDYLTQIHAWGLHWLGVQLPDPDDAEAVWSRPLEALGAA